MARVDVIMPQMGESIAEGTITRWMMNIGDEVKRDESILEISTDKVDADIPSPVSGTLILRPCRPPSPAPFPLPPQTAHESAFVGRESPLRGPSVLRDDEPRGGCVEPPT